VSPHARYAGICALACSAALLLHRASSAVVLAGAVDDRCILGDVIARFGEWTSLFAQCMSLRATVLTGVLASLTHHRDALPLTGFAINLGDDHRFAREFFNKIGRIADLRLGVYEITLGVESARPRSASWTRLRLALGQNSR
jgi:hypothetical protein